MDAILVRTLSIHDPQSVVVMQWHAQERVAVAESINGGCVASTDFGHLPDLVKTLEGPPIGHFSKIIKHGVCLGYSICNTSA